MKNKIHGILFDVSYLWEEYLATILTKQGFQHPNNRKGLGCIYLAEYNRLPRYPDYYREYDRLIVDAKYKKIQIGMIFINDNLYVSDERETGNFYTTW